MNKIENRVGEKWETNEGYIVEIIECFGWDNNTIKFDNGFIVSNRTYRHIQSGAIKNPYHKSVFSFGCIGIGKYSNKTHLKTYQTWKSMLSRCYDGIHPTYKDVTVCEEWCNFQIFALWFENNYKKGFELDKDILVKGNKIYSPETCCFVPREINGMFTKRNSVRGECPIGVSKLENKFRATITVKGKGVHLGAFNTPEEAFQVYKIVKEEQIKAMAEKNKLLITPQTYQALINYKVEITD